MAVHHACETGGCPGLVHFDIEVAPVQRILSCCDRCARSAAQTIDVERLIEKMDEIRAAAGVSYMSHLEFATDAQRRFIESALESMAIPRRNSGQ